MSSPHNNPLKRTIGGGGGGGVYIVKKKVPVYFHELTEIFLFFFLFQTYWRNTACQIPEYTQQVGLGFIYYLMT